MIEKEEKKASVLLIEDEDSFRKSLAAILRLNNYNISEVSDGEEAFSLLDREGYDLVLTDLRMKKTSGDEVLRRVKEISPGTEVIIITAYGSIQSAVEAMKAGAFDYVTKPFKTDEILKILTRALEKRKLLKSVRFIEPEEENSFKDIVYTSKSMDDIIKLTKKIAPTDITVLIEGESGTGKELLAKTIHRRSLRKKCPFVTVNSNLPETLLESELFGFVKGSFTGAYADRKGLFELANSGTILLDEISDMSPALQVRLLRAIQEKEVRRVGGEELINVDVRLIAATNRNLVTLTKGGKFREDLYYRINVMPIYIPPLRERKEDIVPLSEHFLKKYAALHQKNIKDIDDPLREEFLSYNWPGNIRELENTIERGVVLSTSQVLDRNSLLILPEEEKIWLTEAELETNNSIRENEKVLIIKTLKKNKWNYTKSAEELGFSRTTLWRRMKEYGLKEKP